MAVSGVFTFDPSRDTIIEAALRRIGALGVGQSATANQITDADFWLNILVKELMNEAQNPWHKTLAQQALTASSHVTNGGAYYRARAGHTSAATDEPGVGNNWETYWEVTTDVSATAWALSQAYTSINEFSLPSGTIGIEKAFYRDTDDYEIELVTYDQYLDLLQKQEKGRPCYIALKHTLGTRKAFMYPMPDSADYIINYYYLRRAYDYTATANTSDFEQNWLTVLVNGLSHKLSSVYQLPVQERQFYFSEYQNVLKGARANNSEWTSGDRVNPAW